MGVAEQSIAWCSRVKQLGGKSRAEYNMVLAESDNWVEGTEQEEEHKKLLEWLEWVNLIKRGGMDWVFQGLAGLLRGISQG